MPTATPFCGSGSLIAELDMWVVVAEPPALWRRVDHQPRVPGPPLNGPTTREVIQPP